MKDEWYRKIVLQEMSRRTNPHVQLVKIEVDTASGLTQLDVLLLAERLLLGQRERIAEMCEGMRINTERNERYNCVTCEGDRLSCDCEAQNSMLDAVIEKLTKGI